MAMTLKGGSFAHILKKKVEVVVEHPSQQFPATWVSFGKTKSPLRPVSASAVGVSDTFAKLKEKGKV